ncbi:calcium-translocating P-type ATPase, PMCA-type [Bacillus sp. AGMB 02131]|uniref:P-type Ca(2+) transporter n=1 Tax=Peribacillus faecalis TaxID=2772559 RepID=A0A927HCI5_9BACI|nr:calcium-translocating P-type ATPase, PMCA-type [Peribacillus faecalis]MBD3109657.1 calcium-translocating P-type ATPase, PMCA-type [Peribacillus faecalis]
MGSNKERLWHAQSQEEIIEKLQTSKEGLSESEANKRLVEYGKNELRQIKAKSIWAMLVEQLTDPMILILLAACILSFVMHEIVEGSVIIFIVILNAVISIVQEKKAQGSLEALRKMNSPTARVKREGKEELVPASMLVPGDIVLLDDGAMVPADLRLIQTSNLKIQEASLTGESVPVEKDAGEVCLEDCPLGDRINMAYSSSIVSYGRSVGVVVETGMNTEVGNIANLLKSQDEFDTPLKRKLAAVGKTLSIVGILLCVIIFVIGLFYGKPILPLFMTAISLAVAVIPEGLPATATIVMALGVQRMAKRNALIRKLPAVETLGSASVICSDKTGTLTLNKMNVTQLAVAEDFEKGQACSVAVAEAKKYKDIIYGGALCNDASLNPENPDTVIGDPTEGAFIYLADYFGENQTVLKAKYPRLFEQPFDSVRKMMTTVHDIDGEVIAYVKGAVDEVLPLCTSIATAEGERPITENDIIRIKNIFHEMSEQALRVLGFAKRSLPKVPDGDVENELTFIGVVGMIDPPRKEVIEAIRTCKTAGIRTVMITGDHRLTALAIASELGIFEEGNIVVSGDELNKMSDGELDKIVAKATVFARVSPNDKLRIIASLKRNGEVAAMTGDGVNDSPALKAADIGVAMGITGTDVAKDASDMILLDDNFTTIVAAVKEGRRIYRNIQKVIQFLLSGNLAELLTIMIATVLNWDSPFLAIHILWINLVTDTLPALALGIDPPGRNIMKHQPVQSGTLFEKGLVYRVIVHGMFITVATVLAYRIGYSSVNHAAGQTMAFSVLALSQILHAFNQRSNTDSIFAKGNGQNMYLYGATLITAALLFVILFIPVLREIFQFAVLSETQWLWVIALSLLPIAGVEICKLLKING